MTVRTLFVCLLIAISSAAAQPAMTRHEGKLITNGSADTFWVELYDDPSHLLAERVPVNRDGTFSVSASSTQLYEVRVVTSHGAHRQRASAIPVGAAAGNSPGEIDDGRPRAGRANQRVALGA